MELDPLTLFLILVCVVVFVALVFQLVPLILDARARKSEEQKMMDYLSNHHVKVTSAEELAKAFGLIRKSAASTPVTRSTLALLPIIIVGIAILYLITSNTNIITSFAANNTTITANNTAISTLSQSGSLISTLLGVFAGFLASVAGFYFGAKSTTPAQPTDGEKAARELAEKAAADQKAAEKAAADQKAADQEAADEEAADAPT